MNVLNHSRVTSSWRYQLCTFWCRTSTKLHVWLSWNLECLDDSVYFKIVKWRHDDSSHDFYEFLKLRAHKSTVLFHPEAFYNFYNTTGFGHNTKHKWHKTHFSGTNGKVCKFANFPALQYFVQTIFYLLATYHFTFAPGRNQLACRRPFATFLFN